MKTSGRKTDNFLCRSIGLCLALLLVVPAFSQLEDLYFKQLSVEDGLSHGNIQSIFQDHQGYMWFGTEYGLNRYDGYQFTIYQHDPLDSTSIDHKSITCIKEDSQNRLWIGTTKSLNYFNSDQHTFVHYQHDPDNPNSIALGAVKAILEDHTGVLWVSTPGMLHEFQPETGTFIRYQTKEKEGSLLGEIGALYEDSRHNLWVATEKGVRLFDRTNKQFTNPLNDVQGKTDDQVTFFMTLMEDRKGNLWVAKRDAGLRRYNFPTQSWTYYQHEEGNPYSLVSNYVNGLLEDDDGGIWVSTGRAGLNYFDPATGQFHLVNNVTHKDGGLNSKTLNTLYQDNTGGIWIGTWFGGVYYLKKGYKKFKHYRKEAIENGLSANLVQAVAADQQGNLWIGTEGGGGLNFFSRKENTFSRVQAPPTDGNKHLSSLNIKSALCSRSGQIWIGTMEGLDRYDPLSQHWTYYRNDRNDPQSILPGFVLSLLEDAQGYIWAGIAGGGLNRLDPQTATFTHYPYTNSSSASRYEVVNTLLEDRSGMIWVGTKEDGLKSFDPTTAKFTHYHQLIPDLSINAIQEDKQGLLWIGTGGSGLKSFDRITREVTSYTQQDGLPSNLISAILEDESGRLWLSTANGISCFDPIQKTWRNYNISDGLQGNQFAKNSACKTPAGELCFGGVNGFNLFYPNDISINKVPPPVVITDFKLFNKPLEIGAKNSPLTKHIRNTQSITLNHRQSVFSFEFAALNYTAPEKNQYAFLMENYDQEWNMSGHRRFASYTNLPPGEYTFRVKASNNDNVWNESGTSIALTILPKPWLTWWAYTIYACIALGLIYLIRVYELARFRMKNELALERLNFQKNEEVHQLKMDFFTNISHELRSPLTLILSPLESLMASGEGSPFAKRQYRYMERNVRQLLRLINQLLDFRKVELGMMKLKAAKGDVVRFTSEITQVFKSLAVQKNICLTCKSQPPVLEAWFDWDKMEKILFNLLSNAIKFTPEGGWITVVVSSRTLSINDEEKDHAVIEISDSGPGIAAQKLPLIFERFYQVSPETKSKDGGFGIGLAFVKELIEMHHGQIYVSSEVGKGSTFTLVLPLGNKHLLPKEIVIYSDSGKEEAVANTLMSNDSCTTEAAPRSVRQDLVLIVDDDADIRAYLRENLAENYDILEATNGKEAWHITQEKTPDIILCDVLMPEMDGIEYCRLVKTDMNFCHIPVILLTALSAVEHRITGVEAGADAYIPKPFNLQLVQVTIANQIEARKHLRKASQTSLLLTPKEYSPSSMDKEFLEEVIRIIDEHIDDVDFDMYDLHQAMRMSQSSLYRKLKALTDQSINEFIRNIRLSRAAELFSHTEWNISEIAYKVGFTDPKYFSTCFRKRFDMTPSLFRIKHKKKTSV